MIRIDDSLLEEIGLIGLPEHERREMLKHIYSTLEMRVGMRLAERMNDQQLDEFEKFIDGDLVYIENYLNQLKPGWQQAPAYIKELQMAHEASQRNNMPFNELSVKSQFGALTWLETNFPDYKDVVAGELDKLKVEIKQDSSKIIEATGVDQQGSVAPAQNSQQPSQGFDTSTQTVQDLQIQRDDQQPPMAA
ncbi:MAG: hypothetical protein QG593_714 [Patescibacteria group bacterium]|jgi:hypothetical protein|nr:hypothetical protein [Patescibacteria group bacterium]